MNHLLPLVGNHFNSGSLQIRSVLLITSMPKSCLIKEAVQSPSGFHTEQEIQMYKIQIHSLYPRTIPVVLVEVRAHLILYPKARLIVNRVQIIHNTKEQRLSPYCFPSQPPPFHPHSQGILS